MWVLSTDTKYRKQTNLQKLKGVCNTSPLGENMKKEFYVVTETFEIDLILKRNKDGSLKLNEQVTLNLFKEELKKFQENIENKKTLEVECTNLRWVN